MHFVSSAIAALVIACPLAANAALLQVDVGDVEYWDANRYGENGQPFNLSGKFVVDTETAAVTQDSNDPAFRGAHFLHFVGWHYVTVNSPDRHCDFYSCDHPADTYPGPFSLQYWQNKSGRLFLDTSGPYRQGALDAKSGSPPLLHWGIGKMLDDTATAAPGSSFRYDATYEDFDFELGAVKFSRRIYGYFPEDFPPEANIVPLDPEIVVTVLANNNSAVAPVPAPAALPAILSALSMVWWVGNRRRIAA